MKAKHSRSGKSSSKPKKPHGYVKSPHSVKAKHHRMGGGGRKR
jgi:hypothetical protein